MLGTGALPLGGLDPPPGDAVNTAGRRGPHEDAGPGTDDLSEATARTSLLDTARDQGETLAQTADHLLEGPEPTP